MPEILTPEESNRRGKEIAKYLPRLLQLRDQAHASLGDPIAVMLPQDLNPVGERHRLMGLPIIWHDGETVGLVYT